MSANHAPSAFDILHRPLLSMVNEAARSLEEKIVDSPEELDLALIMGTGFPAFRGGLLRSADSLGMREALLNEVGRFDQILQDCSIGLRDFRPVFLPQGGPAQTRGPKRCGAPGDT